MIPAGPRTLVVIDNRPLRHAAWAEYHRARKRSEKARAELRQHEEVDAPAFREWFHRTFPVEISTLRQLHEEVLVKAEQVRRVDLLSDITGRSPQSVWREYKKAEQRDQDRRDEEARTGQPRSRPERNPYSQDLSTLLDSLFDSEHGGPNPFDHPEDDDNEELDWDEVKSGLPPPKPELFSPNESPTPPPESLPARDIYRRLVQHLHPDRGGDWTPARERLWHEVQAAWAARDADWLARLEVDWEAAHHALHQDSPLSHLRRAIRELEASRRDVERKLREYRKSQEWRFTTSLPQRSALRRTLQANLDHDLKAIRAHLRYLNERLDSWQSRGGPRKKRR
ncbi:MAG: hypothetical protein JNN01_15725 [Opitutaceae bacterium]|nr:hypothetical protein [Opitutaceae bacterium]